MLNRKITVGTSPQADVRLSQVGVSRFHLELSPTNSPGSYIVTDLQSTNGTRIITPDNRLMKIQAPMHVTDYTRLLLGNYETTPAALITKWHMQNANPNASSPNNNQPVNSAPIVKRNPVTGEIIIG